MVASDRAKCTKTISLYGKEAINVLIYRRRPNYTPRHPRACSTAHGRSIDIQDVGSELERISRARAIPGGILPFYEPILPKRSRQIKAIFACQKRTSKPKKLANEVPPRRGRDLILLPHVLSYLGTPRQAWNEVKPLATPGAGTPSRVSRLAEPMPQA